MLITAFKKHPPAIVWIGCLFSLFSGIAEADTPPPVTEDMPFYTMRKPLYDMGISLEFANITDVMSNVASDQKHGVVMLNNLGMEVQLDGKKAFGMDGLTGDFSVLQTNGGMPNKLLPHDIDRPDNMEPYHPGFDLYQAYLQQTWMGGHLSLLGGVYDLSNDFYTTDSSDLFINYGLEFGSELAETARRGPAIFPTSSPSLRLKATFTGNWYVQGALSDGINDNPEASRIGSLDFGGDARALVMGEAGYADKQGDDTLTKLAVGGWRYTSELKNILQPIDNSLVPGNYNLSEGVYFLGDTYLYHAENSPTRGLKGFFRIGFADSDSSRVDYSWSTGLVYNGIVPSREKTQLGLTLADAHNSATYREQLSALGYNISPDETLIELTYRDPLEEWLILQPDIQYIINPSTYGESDNNAVILGLRVQINF